MQTKHFLLAVLVAASVAVHDTPQADAQAWHNPAQGYSIYAYNNHGYNNHGYGNFGQTHGAYTRRLTRVTVYAIRPNSAQADLLQPGYSSHYGTNHGFGYPGGYNRRITRVTVYAVRPNSAQPNSLYPSYSPDYGIYNDFGNSSVGVYRGSGL